MLKNRWTNRQVMLEKVPFEFFHYYDSEPPVIESHRHPFYEVYFFLNGNAEYLIEGKIYNLHPGDILLTNSQDVHEVRVYSGKPYERIVLWLSEEFLTTLSLFDPELCDFFKEIAAKDYRMIRPDESHILNLRSICKKITVEQEDGGAGSHALVFAYIVEYLSRICQCYHETDLLLTEDITENKKINEIISYINEHITAELSLDTLSEQFYLSKFYLSHQFRQYTGLSIYRYIIKKRLGIARDLLYSGISVTDACMQCGFGDYSNFLKAFKREFGKTPTEYLKELH